MTEQELRELIRDAVRTRLAAHTTRPSVRGAAKDAPVHPSQHIYITLVNSDDACLIEPDVTCNHCGYCRTHGH